MRLGIAVIALTLSGLCHADGYMFKDGRFPEGKVTVLQLTVEQKQIIALYSKCRDNTYSPYIFHLTPQQSATLLKETGMKPKRFAIFDSLAGDDGTDIEYNVINRFSEDSFEIPHKLLISEKALKNWELNIIGWQASPLAVVTANNLKSGICPTKVAKPNPSFRPQGSSPWNIRA